MCTLEEQDSMARHEIGGDSKLNAFKDIPTSDYVSLTSKDVSADPITKEANNGKKINLYFFLKKV